MALFFVGAASMGCGASLDATVRYELALSSPSSEAAEVAKRRVTRLDEREGLAVGEVSVTASAAGLEVVAKVAAGPRCADFERARALIGEALVQQRRMTIHAVSSAESGTLAEEVRALLGDEVWVREGWEWDGAVLRPKEGLDIPAMVGALSNDQRLVVATYYDAEPHAVGRSRYSVWALEPKPAMGADAIASSKTRQDDFGLSLVVTFTPEGATRFEELTKALLRGYVAFLIDGVPFSIPKVMEPISTGEAPLSLDDAWRVAWKDKPAVLRELAAAIAEPPIAERVTIVSDRSTCPVGAEGAP